jgi:uncharacterized membrane protein YebE (DUF533 family)
MIDPKFLLDRFLGPNAGAQLGSVLGQVTGQERAQPPARTGGSPWGVSAAPPAGRGLPGGLGGMLGGLNGKLPGGFMGGAASGGLLGMLLGGGKGGKGIGGVLSHGGAAALGALAFRAYQNWQQGQAPAAATPATAQDAQAMDAPFHPDAPAADGQPFALALVRAMIGAAKADGHVDAQEQEAIFAHVEQAGLDAEAKAFVFDALSQPTDLNAIAASARTQEQKAEIYLATCLAIDPDHPAERAYLEALAHRLALPADLVAHLRAQADAAHKAG